MTLTLGSNKLTARVRPDLAASAFMGAPAAHADYAIKILQSESLNSQVRQRARNEANRALARDPLAAKGLLVLAIDSIEKQDWDQANRLLKTAWFRTKRDNLVTFAALGVAIKANDIRFASEVTDVILRRRPALVNEIGAIIFPEMVRNAAYKAGVFSLLESNPPWKLVFLEAMGKTADLGLLEEYLARETGTAERAILLELKASRLFDANQYQAAAAVVLELERDATNRSLKITDDAGTSRFDWQPTTLAGSEVGFPKAGDRFGAANIFFSGSGGEQPILTRWLALRPGRVTVEYHMTVDPPERLYVAVSCANGNRLAKAGPGGSADTFATLAFEVPAENCELVRLDVGVTASERVEGVSGVIAFGRLQTSTEPGQ